MYLSMKCINSVSHSTVKPGFRCRAVHVSFNVVKVTLIIYVLLYTSLTTPAVSDASDRPVRFYAFRDLFLYLSYAEPTTLKNYFVPV